MRGRLLWILLYPALLLALVEATSQGVYRLAQGTWLAAGYPGEEIHSAFRRHPHLVGVPRPRFERTRDGVRVSHNALGLRGGEVERRKRPGVVRIVTLGGSTTYGNGVSDEDTWPVLLQEELGDGYEVLNLGVPGYSTVENAIQTAFWLSDYDPDIAIYYEGWNDVRNSHVRALAPDYANFHARHLYWSLGLFHLKVANRSALVHYARIALERVFAPDPLVNVRYRPTRDRLTDKVDARVLALFQRNLVSIIALCRAQGVRPLLVPQLLNTTVMSGDEPGRWVPLIRERDIPKVMRAFNQALVATGESQGADVVRAALDAPFGPGDFLDHGHFTPAGNLRFARLLATAVRTLPARP